MVQGQDRPKGFEVNAGLLHGSGLFVFDEVSDEVKKSCPIAILC